MKKKERDTLHSMNKEELVHEIASLEQKYEQLLLEHDQTKKKNTRTGRNIRVKIAIAKTLFRQKELQV